MASSSSSVLLQLVRYVSSLPSQLMRRATTSTRAFALPSSAGPARPGAPAEGGGGHGGAIHAGRMAAGPQRPGKPAEGAGGRVLPSEATAFWVIAAAAERVLLAAQHRPERLLLLQGRRHNGCFFFPKLAFCSCSLC
ncbi:hypothetical protein BRADI_3g15806v3 [Brachypodium distachyon]|uniref:Uncharacterized protein n=1 Tax=Brachypodium distachyon TaxID=15368 RepID=A0A0Q3I3Q3_BRADI|nr:hypothetical protein BRADI_3g15806v3 [Brachypodium distachyon]